MNLGYHALRQYDTLEQAGRFTPGREVLGSKVLKGARVQFSTAIHTDVTGTVLSVDHGASYPLKVEWFTHDGDKRIGSFHPDEFHNLTILGKD